MHQCTEMWGNSKALPAGSTACAPVLTASRTCPPQKSSSLLLPPLESTRTWHPLPAQGHLSHPQPCQSRVPGGRNFPCRPPWVCLCKVIRGGSVVIALGQWGEATREVTQLLGPHSPTHAAVMKPVSALGSQPHSPACHPPPFPLTNISGMFIS